MVQLLVHTDRPPRRVVEHKDNGAGVGLQGGTQFLDIHLHVAITGKADDGASRVNNLDRHRSRQAVAHGPVLRGQ